MHPVAVVMVRACALCIAEEDHGERATAEMCVLVPPDLGLMRARDVVTATTDRDLLGRRRIRLQWRDGQEWPTFRQRSWFGTAGERRLRSLEEDVASLTLGELWAKWCSEF
ncbi:hypothetical protein [Sanguibacter suaedae]|uniref:Uncharacterized protein n=1 Tax=Sanguibacter suaedae TaxID=2795737 RepID=A0A934M7Y2_9MICO|nr:hypothetical protein [Sanguibacter suaedae]MBI9115932.1 hypothetical protein [Sanguibacter suaedae]